MQTLNCFVPKAWVPSDEQLAIQMAPDHTVLVQANAGAAKTTTLALCLAQALHEGVAVDAVMVLTYTAPACDAMRAALLRVGLPKALVQRLRIQTFDQFASDVLRSTEPGVVPFLATPEAVLPAVWDAVFQADISVDSRFIEAFLAVSLRLKGTLALDLARWDGQPPSDDLAMDVGVETDQLRLFRVFEALRNPQRDGTDQPRFRMPFDATYDLACALADPQSALAGVHELPAWPRQARLVLVDEMHDLNRAMVILLRRVLDTTRARFCGVGDVDQVIYSLAGAEQRYMSVDLDLGRPVTPYPLTATYRFGPALARVAGGLTGKPYPSAAAHATRVVVQAVCDGPSGQAGEGADTVGLSSAQRIAAQVQAWQRNASKEPGKGGGLGRCAVLLRHTWQSVAVENALLHAGLPYTTAGFVSYLMQPEVLFIRALLAVATGDYQALSTTRTRAELVRSVVFFCGVELGFELSGSETPEARMQYAIRAVTQDTDTLRGFMEGQVFNQVPAPLARRMHEAMAWVSGGGQGGPGANSHEGFDRFLDALQLDAWVAEVFVERQRQADAMAYFDGLRQAARAFSSPKAFFDSLGALELQRSPAPALGAVRAGRGAAPAAASKGKVQAAGDALTLATIAAVKGLEFDQVLLPYLRQGVFPWHLAPSERDERNLFYVGITRARRELVLLADQVAPSGFVAGLVVLPPSQAGTPGLAP